jgi:RHS repeat-associated protein
MKRLLHFVALALVLGARVLLAHHCPESPYYLPVGAIGALRIQADVAESQKSHYNMSINSDPSVAILTPDNFDSFGYGEFYVLGLKPGTNNVVLEWTYAPNNASGFCVVQVIVFPLGSDPRDVPDATTAEEAPEAGQASDPVNTYTGELTMEEVADLDLGGPMPVRFSRYYASGLNRQPLVASTMGVNWMHKYDLRLVSVSTNAYVVFNGGRVIKFNTDGANWKLASSPRVPYQLKTVGNERLLLDPEKNWVYHFAADGRLMSIEDTRGNALTLTYEGGQLKTVSDGLGRMLTVTYFGFQQLATVTDGTRTVRFGYNDHYLASVQDAAGKFTTYQYDNTKLHGGLLTSKIFPDGNAPNSQVYDAKGRVIEQSRGEGGKYTFGYDGLLTTITNTLGQVQKHLHDSQGNLIELTDETGRKITSQFDAAGRRAGETTRTGNSYQWKFHAASGELESATAPGLPPLQFERAERDFRGFKIYETSRIIYADGTFESFVNDANGNVISLTDRAGRVTTSSHDAHGRMLAITNPAGGVVTFEYNADGTRMNSKSKLPNGPERITTYGYDSLRRLNRTTYPDGKTVLKSYNNLDLVVSITDEESAVTAYEYGGNSLVKKITYPLGNTLRMAYDRMNELTNVTDHAGRSSGRKYDLMGRLEAVVDRNGNRQNFAYDTLGRMTSYTDAEGKTWVHEIDSEGRVAAVTDPLGHARRWDYDVADRATAIHHGPDEFRIAPDPLGRPLTMEFPPGRATALAYFPDGKLKKVTLPGGIASEYVLDALGLVDTVKDPNQQSWRTARDEFGNLKSFVDPLGRATQYFLDARERISGAVYPGGLGSVSNTFNGRGQITREIFSDGTVIDFGYDANGRLTSGTGLSLAYDPQDNITACNGLAIGRDLGGRITTVTLAPGKMITYAYNARNQATNILDWLGGDTRLQYDDAGRLISMMRPNGVTTAYAYDNANRVAAISETKGQGLASIELTREGGGLVASAKKTLPLEPAIAARVKAMTFDAASQIVGASYDALGRMTANGAQTFAWDLASRLKGISKGAASAAFEYDAFGNLIAETRGGVRQDFVWNYALGLRSPVVAREGGADSAYLVHTPGGELLYTIDAKNPERSFYHFDEAGNTIFLTDDAGAITDTFAYSPYGEVIGRTGSHETPLLFAGCYSVISYPDDGLVYMRRRWLQTESGRFLSRDPNWGISINPNELNPYAYSRSNPLNYIDPHGLDARVNQSGVHTDISVDIWQGDAVVGTLTLSYAAKGYKGKFGGVGEAFSTVIGGTQAELSVDYAPGSVKDTASADALTRGTQIIVKGTREQDERLRLAMAGIIGGKGDFEFVGDGQALIRKLVFQGRKIKHQHFVMDVLLDDWDTYRASTQSCNDFTDAMLDIYFGENWYVGPIFQGEGLVEELKNHLKLKDATPLTADPNGIAPVTSSSRVR